MGEKTWWLAGQRFTVRIQDYSIYPNRHGVENGNTGVVEKGVEDGYWATIQTSAGVVYGFPIKASDMAVWDHQEALDSEIQSRALKLGKLVRVYNGDAKIGDVVKMRTGGPNMCIKSFQEDYGTASVQWFDNENHLHEDKVPLAALKIV